MAGDRDLAVAFVRARFDPGSPGASGWEVTAATGVRGLRLLGETGRFRAFRFSESHPEAFRVLRENVAAYPGATAFLEDARIAPFEQRFDYVDVDPYGTPVPFLPGALRAVRGGGVLAVTATDMMVLAGVQANACERRYGARPIRGRLGPESGLRILIAYLDRLASDEGRRIRPLLAYVRDHHVRAYLEIDGPPGPPGARVGVLDPSTFAGPPIGDRGPYGPLWLGPLADVPLLRSLRVPDSAARPRETTVFLARLTEEAEISDPFFYEPNLLARRLGLARPPSLASLLTALREAGFAAARTHARPEGFRTNAPRAEVDARVRALASA